MKGSLIMIFCCFLWSPDWSIRPNYEVVVFQPWPGIPTVLDSGDSITYYYIPARPTCLSHFYVFFYLPPNSYRPHQ